MRTPRVASLATIVVIVTAALHLAGGDCAQADGGFGAAQAWAQRAAPPEPLSPWAAVDAEIERLVVRGELPFEAWVMRPADRGELAAWLAMGPHGRPGATGSAARSRLAAVLRWERQRWLPASPLAARPRERPGALLRFGSRVTSLHLSPYLRLMPQLVDGQEGEWTSGSRIGFRAHLAWGHQLAISTGLFAAEIDEARSFADPLIAGTDFVLHEEEVTLSARWGPLRFRTGRDRHRWGPGISGTLLLSDSGQPFNFVEYQLRLSDDLCFLALTGETGRNAGAADEIRIYAGEDPVTNPHPHRYLSAHRLLWNVTPDFYVAFSEGARYQTASPHWLYLAGIVPYTLVERLDLQDESSDTADGLLRNNVLWSCDFAWRFRPGWIAYGEILADDIATESSEMPTRGGFQIGTTWTPQWQDWEWTLGAEFTKVSNYTYSVYYQDLCQCDWEHQGLPLGYAGGPDVENYLLRCAADPHPRWSAGSWLRHTRQGEGALGKPWLPTSSGCCPVCDADCQDASAWALSGNVTRTLAIGCQLRYRPQALFWMALAAEIREVAQSDASGRRRIQSGSTLRFQLSLGGS